MPCAYEVILLAYSACLRGLDELLPIARASTRPGLPAPGWPRRAPSSAPRSCRASTAALIVGIGAPTIERVLAHPLAGALLLRLVEDHVDQRLPGLGVDVREAPAR